MLKITSTSSVLNEDHIVTIYRLIAVISELGCQIV